MARVTRTMSQSEKYLCRYDDCSSSFESAKGRNTHEGRIHGLSKDAEIVDCKGCGSEVKKDASKSSRNDSNFCSRSCFNDWKARQSSKSTLICRNCSSEFEGYDREYRNFFCSKNCYHEWQRNNGFEGEDHPLWKRKECVCRHENCQREFYVSNSRFSGETAHFCSDECRRDWMSNGDNAPYKVGDDPPRYTGESHPMWRGGHESYYGSNWRKMREKTLERDNYVCVVCGRGEDVLGRQPDVHHIIPLREFKEPEDANYLDNLVTLCNKHHMMVEHGEEDLLP